MEITKMLTLNTSFISEETSKRLDARFNEDGIDLAIYPKMGGDEQFGWFIYPANGEENLPDDLATALTMMDSLGCQSLCLDCDGPEGNDRADIRGVMTISACHIDMDTARTLDDNGKTNAIPVSVYPKMDDGNSYGWYIYFDHIDKNIPEDLRKCLELAEDNNCSVLVLDSDGPEVDILMKYDWN